MKYLKFLHGACLLFCCFMQLEKFKNYDFGRCPRVYCCGQPCLPVGQSDIPRSSTVKIYCPKCEDIYYPRSKYQGSILLLWSICACTEFNLFFFLFEFYLSALQFICCFSRIHVLWFFLSLTVLVGLDISLLLWTELVWYCLVGFELSILQTGM